jgi:hypothetical protein
MPFSGSAMPAPRIRGIGSGDNRMLEMLRRTWPWALIALACLWLSYTAAFSLSFQTCVGEKYGHQTEQQSEKGSPVFAGRFLNSARIHTDCFGTFLFEGRDAVTAVATAFIALFTLTLWLTNRNQLRHAHRVERAYISCGGAGEVRPQIITTPTGHPIQRAQVTGAFQVQVNNHGKTPGETFRFAIEFCNADAVLPEEPVYSNFIHHHNWIGPGTQSRSLFPVSPPANLRNPMIVYGRVWFQDIFSRTEHWSSFFQSFNRETGDSQSIPPRSCAYTDWDHDGR